MAESKEKLATIRVPRGRSNEEPCLMIGINGRNWLLPRGKTSEVPDYVAEEFNRHMDAVDAYSSKITEIQDEERAINNDARSRLGR